MRQAAHMKLSTLPFSSKNRAAGAQNPMWRWAISGALLGLITTVLYCAPARWLAAALAQSSGGKINLVDAQGRLWDGSARLLLQPGGQNAVLLPGRVRWTAQLAGLGLDVSLLPECCSSQATQIAYRWGWPAAYATITHLDLRLPADLLAGLGTPFNTLGFGGQIHLSSPKLALRLQKTATTVQGQAQMELLQLSSNLSALPALGSYRIAIAGQGDAQVQLSTLAGSALMLEGQGQWQNGVFHFDGQAHAAAGYEDALANILNVIGRRDGARSLIHL